MTECLADGRIEMGVGKYHQATIGILPNRESPVLNAN